MEEKEALVVLAGGFSQVDGRWISRRFGDDGMGPPGSDLRMLAGAYLYQDDPRRMVITSGGRGSLDNLLPPGMTMAGIIKQELIDHGVKEEAIIEEDQSTTTYSQLVALKAIVSRHKFSKLILVSNSHHLPRVEAMLKYGPGLRDIETISSTASADSVVIRKDPAWKKIIEENYVTEPLKTMIANEGPGIEQIKNGTYKYK